eukprot:TRINITY_DN505_c0_g1_i1.p1 TRINITY_DN505_c0_g1~~TRINITY_DN505_c0_g1_i1.p1  ORF type:complete len:213 (+),score=60.53 TRINITY_DN505_c0_g1_i1:69-707(+)
MAAMSAFMPYGGFHNVYYGARYLSSGPNSSRLLKFSAAGLKFWFLVNRGLKMADADRRVQSSADSNVEKKTDSSNQSPAPSPSGGSSFPPEWLKWFLRTLVTAVLPFLKNRLSKIEDQVEEILDLADNVVDAVDNVAEAVENVASDMADKLKDGKLKEAALLVENLSREISEKADVADEIIEKVDAMREKVEGLLEEDDNNKKAAEKEAQAK